MQLQPAPSQSAGWDRVDSLSSQLEQYARLTLRQRYCALNC